MASIREININESDQLFDRFGRTMIADAAAQLTVIVRRSLKENG